MDLVVVFGCALAGGSLAVVAPWVVLASAAGIVALLPRRGRAAFVCALGLMLGFWRARSSIDAHREAQAAATGQGRCAAKATIVSSPVLVHGVLRFDALLSDLACDGHVRAPLRARLYGGPPDLARGDVLDAIVQISPLDRFDNPELGAPEPREARAAVVRSGSVLGANVVSRGRGPPAIIDRARAHVRARIEATFPRDVAPLARALVLGETDLAREDDDAFRASGLSHLLAVSGTHLVVTIVALVALVRALLVRIERLARGHDVGRWAAAIGIPLAWAYASFAGSSGSAVRAAWMLSAALAARALGRAPSGTRALGLSLVLGVLVDPLAAFDVSFVLSAASTAGLMTFGRKLASAVDGAPALVRAAWKTCAASVAATVACAPILATMTSTLPLGGVIANVIAVPIGELAALPLCLLHALLSFWSGAEEGCALAAGGALSLLAKIAHAFGDASWASATVPCPTNAQLGAVAVGYAAFVVARGRIRIVACAGAIVALLVAEIGAIRAGAPKNVLRATMLDVAQGDAALVDLPDGTAMIIDGGGTVGSPVDVGARVIAPVLRARRRDKVRLVVLSHPHPDHFGGLATGLSAIEIGALWDTGQGEREGVGGGYADLLAHMRDKRVPIMRPEMVCGRHSIGGATVEVLAPCPSPLPDRSPNDNSFVLRVGFGRRAFLFVGDAEHEEENDLLRSDVRADVLKVGHHGSRTSSSRAFLEAVRPSAAVISCGARNRFGHPAPGTLEALDAAGIRTFRTDRQGAIVAWTDGNALRVGPAVDGIPGGR